MAWEIGTRTGIVRLVIRMGRGAQEQAQRKFFLSLNDVDWSRTTVYSSGNYGQMFVNLKGREPQGCVEPGAEYEQVLERLEAALQELRDPETGESVVSKIWRGSEIWQGRYADRAPDLFFFTRDMKYKAMGAVISAPTRFSKSVGTRLTIIWDFYVIWSRYKDRPGDIASNLGIALPSLSAGVFRITWTEGVGNSAEPPGPAGYRAVPTGSPGSGGYSAEEEEILTQHLRDWGMSANLICHPNWRLVYI
jgi:hypothetical protein